MSETHLPALPLRDVPNAAHSPGGSAGSNGKEIAATALPPSILTSKPTLMGLLAAFRRRWRVATGLGLIVGAVAAIIAWFLASPLSYTVSTTLHVNSTPRPIMFEIKEDRINFDTYQRSQVALIKSRLVLNSALRDDKVKQLPIVLEQPEPLDWLTKEIQADFALSPEMLRISMTGKNKEAMIVVVDAVREAYLREVVNKEHDQRTARLVQLKKVYTEKDDWLKQHRKVVRELKESLGGGNPELLAKKQEFALLRLNKTQLDLLAVESQLQCARIETATAAEQEKALSEAVIPPALLEEAVNKDSVVLSYEKDLGRLERELADIRDKLRYPDKDPTYVAKKKEQADIQKQLATRKTDLGPKVTEGVRAQRRLELAQDRAKQEGEVAKLEKLEAVLKEKERQLTEQSKGLSKMTSDLEGAKEDIDLTEQVWKKIGAEVEALKVEIDAPARVTSSPEESAYATKRDGLGLKAALGAGLGGFGLVVFGISFLEFRARRLIDATELSQGLRLPVIGLMPRMPMQDSRSVPQSTAHAAAQQLLIESVDTARALILHASRQSSLRVVMITSAVGGEGKTMLAAHLSASMARAGWRALLVDADFRRPSLQTVFNLTDKGGLSDVLRGEADIHEVMQPGPIEGLTVIPAGQCDRASMQALAQGALRGLFDQIKGEFDLIVVDSAPVLPVVDSQLIAQAVDGVILSVLRDVSRLPLIHATYERLMQFQVSLLGAVVHGADVGAYGVRYPYTPIPAAKTTAPTNLE